MTSPSLAQLSPRHLARVTRLAESSMADHFESLYPEEDSPTALFGLFLAHRPRDSDSWDAEDHTIFAQDVFTWLTKAHFDSKTHPRLCAVSALAGMYVCTTELAPVMCQGRPAGATMRTRLIPKTSTPSK